MANIPDTRVSITTFQEKERIIMNLITRDTCRYNAQIINNNISCPEGSCNKFHLKYTKSNYTTNLELIKCCHYICIGYRNKCCKFIHDEQINSWYDFFLKNSKNDTCKIIYMELARYIDEHNRVKMIRRTKEPIHAPIAIKNPPVQVIIRDRNPIHSYDLDRDHDRDRVRDRVRDSDRDHDLDRDRSRVRDRSRSRDHYRDRSCSRDRDHNISRRHRHRRDRSPSRDRAPIRTTQVKDVLSMSEREKLFMEFKQFQEFKNQLKNNPLNIPISSVLSMKNENICAPLLPALPAPPAPRVPVAAARASSSFHVYHAPAQVSSYGSRQSTSYDPDFNYHDSRYNY